MTKLIFMGTPLPVVPVLHRLQGMPDVEIAAVVTPPDRPRGRGRQPEPQPVKVAASALGLTVLQPPNLRSQSVQAELASLRPDVIVVAAYGRLLPPAVLELPPHGCLNLHPSLLPRHRGPSPVAAAILEGDETTGVSLMLLDEGMDTGPVIASTQLPLMGGETAGELTERLFEIGGTLLQENLEPWLGGDLKADPQDDSEATITRKLERADGLINWTEPAATLVRKCRAFDPWPGLYTQWQGRMLKLLAVRDQTDGEDDSAAPGQVLYSGPGQAFGVATVSGTLWAERVQMEGRRAVSGEEFLRGYPEIFGSQLGNPE